MKIQIVAAALPPKLDGIGDYTALLSAELAKSATVEILTGGDETPEPIPGVTVTPTFSAAEPRSVWNLLPAIEAARPDWVLLQYNPFSYGKWGRNLHLPEVMRRVKRRCPGTKIAIMFHEMFVPLTNWKFLVMSPWQRWQFWRLALDADVTFFSVGVWADKIRPWRRGRPTVHLPVGSNVPRVLISREEARARLGIPDGTIVLGMYGGLHVSRMLPWVRDAARAVCASGQDMVLLYVGPQPDGFRAAMGGLPMIAGGPFPPEEVSRRFAAMDIHLVPFVDGVSTRRGTLMTGLQHGVATVGTSGIHTDTILNCQNELALWLSPVADQGKFQDDVLRLANDLNLRQCIGGAGRQVYQEAFAWEAIARQILASAQ